MSNGPVPPAITDGSRHYLYLPYGTTLYGHIGLPNRWLRVTDDDSASVRSFTRGDGTLTDVVYEYGFPTYLTYLTFGHTPFIEVAASGLRSGADLSDEMEWLLSQACLRSYSSRVDALLSLADRKRRSLVTGHNATSAELGDELAACLALWGQLMDTGTVRPLGVLSSSGAPKLGSPLGPNRMRWARKRAEALRDRMSSGDFVKMPYKVPQRLRDAILSGYGVDG